MPIYRKEWFNPVYYHLRHYLTDPNIRRVMIYGGKSAAKTFSVAQLLTIRCYSEKCSAIVYRKTSTSIATTLKKSFGGAITTTYMGNAWTTLDRSIRCNFSEKERLEIVFKGLDKEEKIKGIEGYKYLLLDELDHFKEEEWMQANASLRAIPGQKLFATWNPVDENSWIKKELDSMEWTDLPNEVIGQPHSQLDINSFVKISTDGGTLLIKTTYLDNKWIVGPNYHDENLIKYYDSLKIKNEQFYNVNVLGEWGIKDKNKKFAWAFSKEKHVKDFTPGMIKLYGQPYNPSHIVWLSFDFNVNPMTCTAFHHYANILMALKCFRLENSNTLEICKHIKAYFKPGTIYKVTGDASGKNHSALAPDNLHNFQIIQRELGLTSGQLFVPSKNPYIEENQVLVNSVLNTYEVWIQSGLCDPLIYDLNYVELNEKKEIVKDRSSAKKYADFLDGFRYMINIEFKNYLKQVK